MLTVLYDSPSVTFGYMAKLTYRKEVSLHVEQTAGSEIAHKFKRHHAHCRVAATSTATPSSSTATSRHIIA